MVIVRQVMTTVKPNNQNIPVKVCNYLDECLSMYLANIFLGCFNVKKYSRKIYFIIHSDGLKTEMLIRCTSRIFIKISGDTHTI